MNLVLDLNLDIKVADWAGASTDDGHSHSSYRRKYNLLCVRGKGSRPRARSLDLVQHYTIWLLVMTFSRDCITRRIPVLGGFILKCWKLEYVSIQDV